MITEHTAFSEVVVFISDSKELEHRKYNEWIITTSDETEWIDNIIYSDCYPLLNKSKRHRCTFRSIILNLSMRKEQINIQIDRKAYTGKTCLPATFLPSGVSEICNTLDRKGYIRLEKGYKYSGSTGTSTTIEPTDKLLDLVSKETIKYQIHKDGLIKVKAFDPVNYPPDVLEAQEVLWEYNKTVEPENLLYATYKDDFDQDGRFTGSNVILMKSGDRKFLKIHGEDTFEIDVRNALPHILYALELGVKLEDDAYEIPDYPRKLVKMCLLIMLNCSTRGKARSAIQGELNSKYLAQGYVANDLLLSIEVKHADLQDYFYRMVGRKLMNLEARCMCLFLKKTLQLGIKVYPIYDSAIGAVSDYEVVYKHFQESFTIDGIEPTIHSNISYH